MMWCYKEGAPTEPVRGCGCELFTGWKAKGFEEDNDCESGNQQNRLNSFLTTGVHYLYLMDIN